METLELLGMEAEDAVEDHEDPGEDEAHLPDGDHRAVGGKGLG